MGVVLITLLMIITAEAQDIDYFGLKKEREARTQKRESQREKIIRLFSETSVASDGKITRNLPPEHVRRLLEEPTEESAREYIEDEQFKVDVIKKALAVLEVASKKRILEQLGETRVILYTFEGCKACAAQKEIFESVGVPYKEVTGTGVPADIKTFPTIVVFRNEKEVARFSRVTPVEEVIDAALHARQLAEENPK